MISEKLNRINSEITKSIYTGENNSQSSLNSLQVMLQANSIRKKAKQENRDLPEDEKIEIDELYKSISDNKKEVIPDNYKILVRKR